MKNFDVNNFGVQELNAEEMRSTEGGFLWVVAALIVLAAIDLLQNGKLDGIKIWLYYKVLVSKH